jgi:hypothetical protein
MPALGGISMARDAGVVAPMAAGLGIAAPAVGAVAMAVGAGVVASVVVAVPAAASVAVVTAVMTMAVPGIEKAPPRPAPTAVVMAARLAEVGRGIAACAFALDAGRVDALAFLAATPQPAAQRVDTLLGARARGVVVFVLVVRVGGGEQDS